MDDKDLRVRALEFALEINSQQSVPTTEITKIINKAKAINSFLAGGKKPVKGKITWLIIIVKQDSIGSADIGIGLFIS